MIRKFFLFGPELITGMSEPVISVIMKVLQPLWNQSSPRTNNCLAYSNYSYSGIGPKECTLSCLHFYWQQMTLRSLTAQNISWRHVLSIRVQTHGKLYEIFIFYNKLKWASEQTSVCVAWQITFVLRDSSCQLRASVLLLITAGSQSETRTVAFCCKKGVLICFQGKGRSINTTNSSSRVISGGGRVSCSIKFCSYLIFGCGWRRCIDARDGKGTSLVPYCHTRVKRRLRRRRRQGTEGTFQGTDLWWRHGHLLGNQERENMRISTKMTYYHQDGVKMARLKDGSFGIRCETHLKNVVFDHWPRG